MAEPTTKFTTATRYFVSETGAKAASIAKLLGVSQLAIVGAVANEYDTRYNYDIFFTFHGQLPQKFGDWWVEGADSHEELVENYKAVKSGSPNPGSKLGNHIQMDIGPGNIRIETAIDLIRGYVSLFDGTDNDPLDLIKYGDNYPSLVADLLDFKDPTATYAVAGLYLSVAQEFFLEKAPSAWDAMTEDERDALLVTYYKLGGDRIEKNINKSILASTENSTQYKYNARGDGGQQHLNNVDMLRDLLRSDIVMTAQGGDFGKKFYRVFDDASKGLQTEGKGKSTSASSVDEITDVSNEVVPKPPLPVRRPAPGTNPQKDDRQGFNNPVGASDLLQPASHQRPIAAQDGAADHEAFDPLGRAEIANTLPGVSSALERHSKAVLNHAGYGTNKEHLSAEPPIPRPRPKLNPITEGYLKDMPDDGRLILAAEMVGFNGRKEADKAEAARMARFDVQRKMAQDLEDVKAGKVSTVWDRYGHPKAVRDLLGEEAYQSFVDDRLEAGIISNATAGLHLLQDAELFGIADGTTALEAPHEKLAELMMPKVLAAAAERARDILDMRRTKPSEAVLLSSDLSNRKAQFDAAFDANEAVDAEEMDAFLFYHEAAQREIGIAEPAIEMIPPRWASQVAARFEVPQAGNGTPTDRRAREAELKQHYTELQQSFGPRTDDVIAYSLARTASNGALPSGHAQ